MRVTGGAGAAADTTAATAGAGGSAGAIAGATAAAAGAAGTTTTQSPATACDKPCLLGFLQMYLDAMLAHDPSTLPVSDNLKYTEQGERAKLGDAVWQTFAEPIAKSRLDFADPVFMNVGTQLGFYESGMALVRYGLRLKVENGQITEIESMAVRMPDHFAFSAENLEPKPVFLEKPAKPNSREELLAITNLYADYLEGKKQGADLPFAEDCTRYENGVPLAQGKASFEAQSWSFKVEPRRILIIDEEMGITWGNLPFYSDGLGEPLVVGEAFKIVDGEFKMIQAAMRYQNNKEWE
jgi:hypothetical protein